MVCGRIARSRVLESISIRPSRRKRWRAVRLDVAKRIASASLDLPDRRGSSLFHRSKSAAMIRRTFPGALSPASQDPGRGGLDLLQPGHSPISTFSKPSQRAVPRRSPSPLIFRRTIAQSYGTHPLQAESFETPGSGSHREALERLAAVATEPVEDGREVVGHDMMSSRVSTWLRSPTASSCVAGFQCLRASMAWRWTWWDRQTIISIQSSRCG